MAAVQQRLADAERTRENAINAEKRSVALASKASEDEKSARANLAAFQAEAATLTNNLASLDNEIAAKHGVAPDRLVMLPHLGSATAEAREEMGFRALNNLEAFFNGETPPDRVN